MNQEVVQEMMYRRILVEDLIRMMRETNQQYLVSEIGPVSLLQLKHEARSIDMMIMDELDELPISAILINLI